MVRRPLRWLPACIVVLGVTGAACGTSAPRSTGAPTSSGSFPVTIAAANGTVRIAARPRAVVSLSPTATEMLYAVGAGAQVKAVDKDSDYPEKAPHTSLDAYQPNVEAIVAYDPDLVIVSGDSGDLNEHLASLHIPVLELPAAATLRDAYRQIDEVGDATGHRGQASAEVASMKSQIASIVARAPKTHTRSTYYYELDPTYFSVTSSTFVGKVLGLLGLRNIADAAPGAAASGGYPQLSAEFIVQSDPDYVFLADTVCCGQSAATVAARPGWSTITAVRKGQVVKLNDDVASRWGPRVVVLLRTAEQALAEHGSGS